MLNTTKRFETNAAQNLTTEVVTGDQTSRSKRRTAAHMPTAKNLASTREVLRKHMADRFGVTIPGDTDPLAGPLKVIVRGDFRAQDPKLADAIEAYFAKSPPALPEHARYLVFGSVTRNVGSIFHLFDFFSHPGHPEEFPGFDVVGVKAFPQNNYGKRPGDLYVYSTDDTIDGRIFKGFAPSDERLREIAQQVKELGARAFRT